MVRLRLHGATATSDDILYVAGRAPVEGQAQYDIMFIAAAVDGKRCGLKDSAALMLKRRIAADLIEFFGEEVVRRLLDGVRPSWESDLRMSRERHLCHVASGSGAARRER